MVPKSYARIKDFVQRADSIAAQTGVHATFEPYVFGDGIQITWLERRADSRINLDRFLTSITTLADQTGMGLQLSLETSNPQIKTLFHGFGFETLTDAGHLHMERRPLPAGERRRRTQQANVQPGFDFQESAPPGGKAEHFIKGHKADFKKRYGKRWKQVLYATAWKNFGESRSLRSYLGLIEALR